MAFHDTSVDQLKLIYADGTLVLTTIFLMCRIEFIIAVHRSKVDTLSINKITCLSLRFEKSFIFSGPEKLRHYYGNQRLFCSGSNQCHTVRHILRSRGYCGTVLGIRVHEEQSVEGQLTYHRQSIVIEVYRGQAILQ